MTEHRQADPFETGGARTVGGSGWSGNGPDGGGSHQRAVPLSLAYGAGVCLVRSCGWTCCAFDRGSAARRHTRATGHPTLYRPVPVAGVDLAKAGSRGIG